MLGHGAGIGYTGPGPRMGPIDNFSLVTGQLIDRFRRCQLSSPVSVINFWWSSDNSTVDPATVEICIQQLCRVEDMVRLLM